MSKSNLTWYKSKARKIMRNVRALKQTEIAETLSESRQVISYRMKNVYERELSDWVQILDLAGYEITEKEEVEEWVREQVK